MKRHPGLRELSGEHHGALVLARGLRAGTPAGLRGDLPSAGEPLLNAVRERFARELEPHFRVEERELLPLSDCGAASLRAHAKRIRQQHAELRALVASLTLDNLSQGAEELSAGLEAHVRFEERQWFPALEAALDAATLQALQRRLKREPEALIGGFHRDAEGAFVAELDCGHTRHVRHAPPFQLAAWVESDEGRASMIGRAIPCASCRMPRLPPCAAVYKSTPEYDHASVPAALLRSHTLRADTWGRIAVHEGRVTYVLEDEDDLAFVLHPQLAGTVAPKSQHHIEPDRAARFHIDFLRLPPPDDR